jgi:diketogulonate reductase-like aldo/keto reductase
VDQRVAEQCRKWGIAVVGYSPLESDGLAKAHRGYAVLDRIAQAHGATRQQVVLAFLIRQAAQFVIPRSVNPAHTLENAAAADLRLSDPEQNEIDSAFPASRAPKRLPVTTGPNC